jgi:hypothetical protein
MVILKLARDLSEWTRFLFMNLVRSARAPISRLALGVKLEEARAPHEFDLRLYAANASKQ